MNVVGKVGSFISQGVYSVATPFHPFGGAVDIIVVQQPDGTFRSTPWYVRFGKFQGVLKGAEKIVRIAVNGVEADFHMYLDNSGEAYFIKEVTEKEDLKEADATEIEQKDNNSNNDVEKVDLGMIERTASDSGRSFYEASVELSEYGSSRYSNLDVDENYVESENLNSEVVLVSIDGHILTAPISSLERNTDNNVQLSTPQFHLGPGEEADFCEDTADFTNYLSLIEENSESVVEENSCQVQQNVNLIDGKETNPESASTSIRKEDIFKSCLDIPALINHDKNCPLENIEDEDNSQDQSGISVEKIDMDIGVSLYNEELGPSSSCPPSDISSPIPNLPDEFDITDGNVSTSRIDSENFPVLFAAQNEGTEEKEKDNEVIGESEIIGHIDSGNTSPHSVTLKIEEKIDDILAVEECSPQGSEEKSYNSEIIDLEKITSSDNLNTDSIEQCSPQRSEDKSCRSEIIYTKNSSDKLTADLRFEISLCGNLLNAGMGFAAAAEVFEEHRISEGDFKMSAAAIIKNENLVVKYKNKFLTWEKAAPIVLGAAAYDLDLNVDLKDAIFVEEDEDKFGGEITELPSTPSGRRWRLWPIPFRRVKTLEHTSSTSSSDEVFVDSESGSNNQINLENNITPTSTVGNEHKQFLRINVPTTQQIASLNLNEGQNMVTFRFSTRVLGMQQVDAHIYLWKWNARIVISDVDGTITKSDVLGQFMPLVGRDWTQSGVARLFSAIKENGYQLLFLSARAIVQAYLTRSFLNNIKQDGKALPNGPVVISPDGLFPSLYREVIRRAPHEFKIACLEDIKALFPSDYNPFYAGFGNRDTDELSYRKIGIPKGKIFIINPKGEVAISQHRIDVKSYTSLHTLVNDMFPPTSMVEQEDFNSWNYWRMPLPDLD